MDALDVFGVIAKIRRVVDFILEDDAGGFVGQDLGRLDCVVGLEEVVV